MREKLMVPFLFCPVEDKGCYAWIFCKYLEFCLKNDMVMIVEEEYCKDKDLIKQYSEGLNPPQFSYTAPSPSIEDVDQKLEAIHVTVEEKKALFGDKVAESSIRRKICCEYLEGFEELVNKKLDEVELRYGKIEVIVTWIRYPSLVKCAERRGIRVLGQELSIIRGNECYRKTLGYFNFDEKYESKKVKEKYLQFCGSSALPLILSRKEILSLVLMPKYLERINSLDEAIYEIGVDADAERDFFFRKYSMMSQKTILRDVNGLINEKQVLARFHPSSCYNDLGYGFIIDDSPNSLEWVLKCKRIVSGISNVGVEAMLFGRTSYILCDAAPYFNYNISTLSFLEDSVVELSYLNYILFGYFTPWELMFDMKYILWRLSDPEPNEIYEYNLRFFLKSCGTEYDQIEQANVTERLQMILQDTRDLSGEVIEKLVCFKKEMSYSKMIEHYGKIIEHYESELHKWNGRYVEKCNHIQIMENSTSWKMTEPLRKAGQLIKKTRK